MITVRFAREEDAQAIADICREAWRVTYEKLYSKEYIEKVISDFYNLNRIKQECKSLSKDWHGYIIAEENQKVVGCIGGAVSDDTGFIYVLYVKPNLKGRGIGSALLTFLTTYQKEHFNILYQEVNVTTGNDMGIPFYKKHGFQFIEEIPNWIDESEGSVNRYQRTI